MTKTPRVSEKPLQVLLLEDRPADAELIVDALERAGFVLDWQRVETEKDFVRRLTPTLDLVLADYALPSFDALGALAAVRARDVEVPVIVVSGTIGDERAVECLKAGAVDYVLKDQMARLGPAVERALNDHQMRIVQEETKRRLEVSEEHMRGILSTIEDVVFSESLTEKRLIYINPAAEKLFGRPVADFYEDVELWFRSIHPEDHVAMQKQREQLLRWGATENEYRIVRPDYSVRHVAARAWAGYDENGKPVRVEGILTDITERVRAQEESVKAEQERRKAERLQALADSRAQSLRLIAHELNTPITPMKIQLHLLGKALSGVQDKTAHDGLAILKHNVERLAMFLQDLLDVARLEGGHLEIKKEQIRLDEVVRQSAQMMQTMADDDGVELVVEAPAAVTVAADPRRIQQVLVNLLSNAIKFTPAGGRVHVSIEKTRAGVAVHVEDTGRGIPPTALEQLFRPFSQLEGAPQGKHTGTGLGLYICKGIMEQHRGSIWADSEGPGKGARFSIQVPA